MPRRRPTGATGEERHHGLVGQPDAGGHQRRAMPSQELRWGAEGQRRAVRCEREDEVGEGPREVGSMLDEDECRRARCAQHRQPLGEGQGAGRVEVGRRLVEDEEARMGGERAGQGEALLLAAREPGRPAPVEPAEAGLGERGGHPGAHGGREPAPPLQPERHVVLRPLHDQLAGRILEDDADPSDEGRRVGARDRPAVELKIPVQSPGRSPRDQPGDRPGQGALARSGGSRHDETGARCQVEGDARDGRPGPARIGDGDVPGDDGDRDRRARSPGPALAGPALARTTSPAAARSLRLRRPGSPRGRPPGAAPGRGRPTPPRR